MTSPDVLCFGGNVFIKVMETFPCLFNIGMMNKPNHHRLTKLIKSLGGDMWNDEEENKGQRIEQLNVLSWLYFQAGDLDEARSKNDDALCLDRDNIMTLGNRAFLEWYSGTDLSAFLGHLQKLKLSGDFPNKRLEAKSIQAKLLFRLGGIYNMSSCIPMYEELVERRPDNFEWKYMLALARRRLMVMVKDRQDEYEIQQLFRHISENATEPDFKSSAMCELAIMLVPSDYSAREVEDLFRSALDLSGGSSFVLRQYGMALTRLSNPRSISLLEQSASLEGNSTTEHTLAKALINFKLTRNMDRTECDRKAVMHFQASYDLSFGENINPLVDLGYLYLNRNQFNASLGVFKDVVQNWMLKEVYRNPFTLSKAFSGLYKSLKKTKGTHPSSDRLLSIALSVGLEQFRRSAPPYEQSEIFDLIINPGPEMWVSGSPKHLFSLIIDCCGNHTAVKKLRMMERQGRLENQQEIEKEAEDLMEKGHAGEALLMLDISQLKDKTQSVRSQLRLRVMLQEAERQLSQGLVSCKLLFHKLFELLHSPSLLPEEREIEGGNDKTSAGVDVLIFHDGYHWKPFLQDNSDQSSSEDTPVGFLSQNRMIENVLTNLYDLDTITNPWLLFSGDNRPDTDEFSTLLRRFKVRLVLLVVGPESSDGFLQMADFLLSETCQATETDSAIVYMEGAAEDTFKSLMPTLASTVRSFQADERGFCHQKDSKSDTDLVGTEILDAYFSGNVQNAIEFFKFLAPHE